MRTRIPDVGGVRGHRRLAVGRVLPPLRHVRRLRGGRGEYDTAYFDAETLCCACGGGTTGDGTIDGWEPEEDDPTDPDEPVEDLEILGTWDTDYAREYTFSNDAFYYLYTDDTYTGIPSEYTITHYDNEENYLIARHRRTAYSARGLWGRYDWHVRPDGEHFWCETTID